MLLHLASCFATVVRQKFEFWQFLIILYLATVSVLLYLMQYYKLYGLVLFRKGDFCHVKCL